MPLNFFIILFFVGGWLSSRLFSRMALPGILGMVLFGIALGTFGANYTPELIVSLDPFLKSLALIVILLRAGLGIHKQTLARIGGRAVLMSSVPCLMEAAALSLAFHYFFGFDWPVAAVAAFLLSAVSPAVVIPSMLDLREKGHGKRNEVPTLVLAGASVDDVIAITFFSAFLAMAVDQSSSLLTAVISIPLSIIGGIIAGLVIGFPLALFFRNRYRHIRATEKTLLLLMAALFVVEVGELAHLAALLAVMVIGFIMLEKAEHVAHELALKLGKVWVVAEIVLFVLIGMAVDLEVAWDAGLMGLLVIHIGLLFRSLGVLVALAGSRLSGRERLFCVIAYLPKATVQAALGTVPLAAGIASGQVILSVAVLSIVYTAPLGLLLIRTLGPRLLDCDEAPTAEPAEDAASQ